MAGPKLFEPISIRDVTLKNRVVVAPMHQYAADKGFATDWHLMNAGRYAAGGAGLVIMESTKVERRGCGTVGDLGIWDDAHIPGLRRCVDFIRQHNAVPGIQLGHSGPQGAALSAVGGRRPAQEFARRLGLGGLGARLVERPQRARKRSGAARAHARGDSAGDRALGAGRSGARTRRASRCSTCTWRTAT